MRQRTEPFRMFEAAQMAPLGLQLRVLLEADRRAAFRLAWREAVLRVIWAQQALRAELQQAAQLVLPAPPAPAPTSTRGPSARRV